MKNTKSNSNKISKKTKRTKRIVGNLLPNNRKRRANVIRGKKIAAASAQNFKKRFTVLRQNGNSVRVTGRDLIYSIPDDLTSPIQDTNVITVIPANPAYWKGTRIAALASGYQNYRPISFKITYIPMCAVTQQGNVIGGTIWDDGIDNDNLQQSLRTSNGGFLTQCYVPHTTQIRPKSNLQFNLYRMGGEFATTSNPFLFIALAIGCKNVNNQRIVPGYFYVTWSFELKNPIGSINTYNNTGLIQYQNVVPEMNNVIVNIDPTSDVPFGAYINLEVEENELKAYYNDTPIEIPGTTPVWAFTSVTRTSTARLRAKIPIYYDATTTGEIRLETTQYRAYLIPREDRYDIYVAQNMQPGYNYRLNLIVDVKYLLTNLYQNFGQRLQEDYSTDVSVYNGDTCVKTQLMNFQHYIAPKDTYTIAIATNNKQKPIMPKPIKEIDEETETESLIQGMKNIDINDLQ